MQRTSIEFERQRHLANWFIKSSPHMANSQSLNPNGAGGVGIVGGNINNNGNNSSNSNNNKVLQKSNNGTKNGTITAANSLFLLMPSGQKPPPLPMFTSQTNLPLQIVTSSSGQEGHKLKLRRFNSHDTSANMFSVAEFENARLVRRNEIELKQRKQQRLRINSNNSGGDCSTGDSKGSKYSNDSQSEPLPADVFLERYPLPRIVRISNNSKLTNETLQSSSSNSSSSSSNSSLGLVNKGNCDQSKQSAETFLLYRHLQQRKIYHGYNTKSGGRYRKKGVMIPQEYPGYFSFVNEKGNSTATMYTTLIQLIRERVYKFISVDNLPAFTESQSSTDTFQTRAHYIKSTARGGQVFRLLAVFEDGKPDNSQATNKNSSSSGREKEKGRYAQLLNENRQILYVSLTTKGKFYEIEPGIPQILQKTGMTSDAKKKINPDCVHRINNMITAEKEFPINLKFISGPAAISNFVPEYLTITRISKENVLIACPIENIEAQSLNLRKLHVTPQITLTKCFLDFEDEQRMLANQNVQNILKFCQFNCDHFLKMVELEIFSKPERNLSNKGRAESLKILKPLHFPKLLKREKSVTAAHEREDSIIFLSKNDLVNLESNKEHNNSIQTNQNRISDKMKVFQSTKKKWFKRSEKQHNSLTNLNIDEQIKRMSMERYNDMSKLLQERFVEFNERSTSEIGCTEKRSSSTSHHIQKSLSLQEVDFIDKPDLVLTNLLENNRNNTGSVNNINSVIEIKNKNDEYELNSNNDSHYQLLQNSNCQQSFISEKLYSEFHVKTRQYSKSSSSLHQLLNFAIPQRTKATTTAKAAATVVASSSSSSDNNRKDKKDKQIIRNLELSFSDISLKEFNQTSSPITAMIDDLPYSSVRDSLLTSDNLFNDSNNIYAEIVNNNNERDTINEINDDDNRGAMSMDHK